MHSLQHRLEQLSNSVAAISDRVNRSDGSVVQRDILTRLSELEERLEELERSVEGQAAARKLAGERREEGRSLSELISVEDYRPTAIGEAAYEVDEGKPIAHYSEKIYDSFHEVGDVVQLHDFECRQSVCRIAYSGVGDSGRLSESEDPATLLIDRLSDNLGESALDIIFSREQGGPQVMYVQLR